MPPKYKSRFSQLRSGHSLPARLLHKVAFAADGTPGASRTLVLNRARGEATEGSDLDLLVRFEKGRSLLDQGGMLMDLQDLLGIKVDVVSEGALHGRFGDIVLREAVPL